MADSQVIEILGRNRLVAELFAAGVEVAYPARDRGVDLIAYCERNEDVKNFIAVPMQVKASSRKNFSINKKYARIANLLIVFIWGVQEDEESETYALTYKESFKIAKTMKWIEKDSWTKGGTFRAGSPNQSLLALLEPYKMTKEAWKTKLKA